jgi:2-succinyl-6-hydroxy-2,4-cyclohexadiene-1-carboxylate synthase
MSLHTEVEGTGLRIVLVHGFTQTSECWNGIADDLSGDHEVVRVDAPGHGRSEHADADLWQGAELLGVAGGVATYLGYSMGGRLCLHLALARPDLVEGLVLVGATAGIRDADERAKRVESDDERAAHLEEIGVDAFLDEWLSQPLFVTLPREAAALDARRANTVEGLAASLRAAGTGRQEPLWDRLHELAMPILVIAGELDLRFGDLGREMAAAIGPNAAFVEVPGAGHTAHLEQPGAFLEILRRWLADLTR